jgi:hypothetical protein
MSTARLRKLEDHAHMYTEITQDKMHLLDRAGTYKHTILPVNFWILLKLAFVKLHPLGGGGWKVGQWMNLRKLENE